METQNHHQCQLIQADGRPPCFAGRSGSSRQGSWRFLFGDFQQVYLLSPGQTVESVNISEVKEGGKTDVKDESVVGGA